MSDIKKLAISFIVIMACTFSFIGATYDKGRPKKSVYATQVSQPDDTLTNTKTVPSKTEQSYMAATCEDAIKKRAQFPSSVDFDWGYKATPFGGNTIIGKDFTAKNAFGMEIRHYAACIFDENDKLIKVNIRAENE